MIQTDFSVACVRPESSQLFFLFTGTGLRPAGVQTVDVIARTPLASRNIVIVRDQDGSGYEHGLGAQYRYADGIVRWQKEQIASLFPHAREVFCMGVSIGGLTAIQTACRLGARAAWSMAGRVIKPDIIRERLQAALDVYQRAIGRTRLGQLTADEEERLQAELDAPAMKDLCRRLADASSVIARDRLRDMVADVRRHANGTDCHFYCAETNVIDRECAEAFQECPNATVHYVTPEPNRREGQAGFVEPDHSIVAILNRRGEWQTLLSPYV